MSSFYDVIVLGVGGMGSAASYHLAKKGAKVLGLDQFELAHGNGSSTGESRIIRRAYFEHPSYIPLLNRAYELWAEIERESGLELFTHNGMIIYGEPSTSAVYQGTLKSAQAYGIPVLDLSREEALERYPYYVPPPSFRAVLEPDAGFLRVEDCVRTHAQEARKKGAEFRWGEKALSYEVRGDCVEVRTDRGEIYRAARLVVSGGPWSNELLRELRLPLQLHRVIQFWFEAASSHSLSLGTPCFAFHMDGEFYYGFPMLDGRTIKIAAHRKRDPITKPSQKNEGGTPAALLRSVESCIQMSLPEVSTRLDRTIHCIYTMTPDEHFIIDRHPEQDRVAFAAGFSGHGFKFSSVVGEILAELALEGKSSQPIDFLRLRDFTRASTQ